MGSHTLLLAKRLCNLSMRNPSPGANSPDTASCLAWSRGHHFASGVSHGVEKPGGPRGRGDNVLYIFACQVDRLASAPLGRQGTSRQQPRLQSRLPGLLRTSGHNRKQSPRPLSGRTEHQNEELAGPITAVAGAGVR